VAEPALYEVWRDAGAEGVHAKAVAYPLGIAGTPKMLAAAMNALTRRQARWSGSRTKAARSQDRGRAAASGVGRVRVSSRRTSSGRGTWRTMPRLRRLSAGGIAPVGPGCLLRLNHGFGCKSA